MNVFFGLWNELQIAEKAMKSLNGKLALSRRLAVHWAKNEVPLVCRFRFYATGLQCALLSVILLNVCVEVNLSLWYSRLGVVTDYWWFNFSVHSYVVSKILFLLFTFEESTLRLKFHL